MGARTGVRGREPTGVRVLYVDGEGDGAGEALLTLADTDGFEVDTVDHAAAALDALDTDTYDCLVSGYDLTQIDGLSLLREVRDRWPDLPFVLYTDAGSEQVASEAFSAGATDYVEKTRADAEPSVLVESLRDAVDTADAGPAERSAEAVGVLFEELPDPAIRLEFVDGDAVVRAVNPAFEETFGFSADALVGRSAGVLQVPTAAGDRTADADGDADTGSMAAEHPPRVDTTVTRVTADGSRTFRYRTVPFTEPDGTTGVYGVYTEPTDGAAERDGQPDPSLDRDRLDAALDRTATGVWVWDPERDRVHWHAAAEQLFGMDGDADVGDLAELLGHVHPADRDRVEAAFERARDGRDLNVEFRTGADDGEWRWVAARGHLDGGAVVGVFVDETARHRREAELHRYRRIVETSNDPVYVLDTDGRFEFVDDAFVDAMGYDRAEIVGEHVSTFLDDEDVADGQEIVEALRTSDIERGVLECSVETAYGTERWCEISIALLGDGDGVEGTVGIVRDVTDRKEREQELERQTERLEEFASVVAHDLRNPLTVAIGHTEVLRDEYDDEFLDRVQDAHERMERLIDGLLTLAREGRMVDETEPAELASVATDAWATVATGDADIDIETDATVSADPDRLRTLFENLFRNAIDHGGEDVTVTVTGTDSGFVVGDDGPGVPEEDRETVFDRGYSTDEDGTGFGLAIVDGIADAHGWTVTAGESADGGARFEVADVETLN